MTKTILNDIPCQIDPLWLCVPIFLCVRTCAIYEKRARNKQHTYNIHFTQHRRSCSLWPFIHLRSDPSQKNTLTHAWKHHYHRHLPCTSCLSISHHLTLFSESLWKVNTSEASFGAFQANHVPHKGSATIPPNFHPTLATLHLHMYLIIYLYVECRTVDVNCKMLQIGKFLIIPKRVFLWQPSPFFCPDTSCTCHNGLDFLCFKCKQQTLVHITFYRNLIQRALSHVDDGYHMATKNVPTSFL